MARNKRDNRRSEDALRQAELLAVHDMLLNGQGAYHGDDLRRLWNVVMLNQFHDILPGTSISEVYEVSDREYGELLTETHSFCAARVRGVFGKAGMGEAVVVNPSGWARNGELALIDAHDASDAPAGELVLRTKDTLVPLQAISCADGRTRHIAPLSSVPPLGGASVRLELGQASAVVQNGLTVMPGLLENALIRAELNEHGQIVSIFDKRRRRELLSVGKPANRLVVYEDKPVAWDAWDIDWYFHEKCWQVDKPLSIEVTEQGPWRAALRIVYAYESSNIVQIVSLAHDATTLEFDTFVDWHEHQSLLKAEFDFDLNTSEIAAEIQFGHVTRQTHSNTSWDQAKFEASMHRWIDISEPDFGAALLNDCKYGYDANGTSVRLTLIKSGIWPNEQADIGKHQFRYALCLHHGRFSSGNIPRQAEAFSAPLRLDFAAPAPRNSAPPVMRSASLAQIDRDNIAVQSVKRAEDSGHVIIRLYDTMNIRSTVLVRFCAPLAEAQIVDLLEENAVVVRIIGGDTVELDVRPHEIITLKVMLAPAGAAAAKDLNHA